MPSTERTQERNAARRRVVRITQATAVAAVLTTGAVAGLAAETPTTTAIPPVATVAATPSSSVDQTLAPSSVAPTTSSDDPVATSGGS
jgi:ammonia channel protein AmtB